MKKVIISIILLLFVIILQSWFTFITFKYPVLAVATEINDDNSVMISRIYPDGMAYGSGLQVGDIVTKINNQQAIDYFTVYKWRSIEQADFIEFIRDGKIHSIDLSDINNSAVFDYFPLIGEILSFSIAILLYRNLPSSKSAKYLSLLFSVIGFIFMSVVASSRGDALGKIFVSVLMALLPILFLHFLIVFLKEKCNTDIPSRIIKFLYIIIALLFVSQIIYFTESEHIYFVYNLLSDLFLITMFAGLLASLIFLTVMYFKLRKKQTYASTVIKTVWFSTIISFAPITILSLLPFFLFGYEWANSFVTGWFVLFFPLTFAYLIASKKLYDIDLITRRILFTILLAILPTLLLTGTNFLIFQNGTSVSHFFFSFLVTLIVISFILYWLEYFTTKLEKVMFPRKYYLQEALKKIASDLKSITQFRELKDIILRDIIQTLQVFGAAIVFKYRDHNEIICEGEMDEEEIIQALSMADQKTNDHLTVFEINRHEEFTGYLVVGMKKTGTFLSQEEINWLQLIISYLAVSLENIHLIRKLTVKLEHLAGQMPDEHSAQEFVWFRKLMFELQEKERVRIANELHDTTMQDLFFLKRRLTSLRESEGFSDNIYIQLDSLIQYVEVINMNLRQSCFELHPHLLQEIGLIGTIQKLVEEERPVCSFEIYFLADPDPLIEQWDMDTKGHLFRLVQELLNNAKKHSDADRIHLSLGVKNDYFYLTYKDNGVGFEPQKPVEREITSSGIGLAQLKSRVYYLNGQFTIESAKDKGVAISITIPIKKEMTA